MIIAYYDAVLILSVCLVFLYILLWHKHNDVHITLLYFIVPVANFGYMLMPRAATLEEALNGLLLTYIGGTYLPLFVLFIVLNLCKVRIHRVLRVLMFAVSTALLLSTLTIGKLPIYYKSVSMVKKDGVSVLIKEYGPLHTVFIGLVALYLALSVGVILYSYFKKKQVSRKTIFLLFLPVATAAFSFFAGRYLVDIDPTPASYAFALMICLIIAYRMCLYDVTDTAVESLVEAGQTGLASFDFGFRYLGSNETAKTVFPELNGLTVDRKIDVDLFMKENLLAWLTGFAADNKNNQIEFERGDRIYLVSVNYLFDGKRKRGYELFITDDTQNRKYVKLLGSYNEDLKKEVEKKTAHIIEMHDQLILGMATMVESRDNSTGGHIRRSSEVVRILVEEMKKENAFGMSEEFCRDIVKAAPMHDLGKIAVDDAILRKPGRYTPEEFEKMKKHASEGARIVHEILKNTDDREFARIAENVAHYHHERVDGSGYPEGLKGDAIPLCARIMAVADVYDALVSKRVYKEKMSFEKANAIIKEGMGSQFDAALLPYYVAARPRLEEYYKNLEEKGTTP